MINVIIRGYLEEECECLGRFKRIIKNTIDMEYHERNISRSSEEGVEITWTSCDVFTKMFDFECIYNPFFPTVHSRLKYLE